MKTHGAFGTETPTLQITLALRLKNRFCSQSLGLKGITRAAFRLAMHSW